MCKHDPLVKLLELLGQQLGGVYIFNFATLLLSEILLAHTRDG